MSSFFEDIRRFARGTFLTDPVSRTVYSVDASIYELSPLAIFLPESIEDVHKAIEIAKNWHVPITPRGAATGITGGCLGRGLVIDASKSLNYILEINIKEEYAVVEPGVVQDALNKALAPSQYRLGPDTSTGNRATIGGMLANNAAGSRSLTFGRMSDHILEAELILSTGEKILFKEISKKEAFEKAKLNSQEGAIYQTVLDVIQTKKEEIQKRFPKIPRHVSGYNLDALLDEEKINLAKLIAGSEGTLGFTSKIKVRIAPALKNTAILVFPFENLQEAFAKVPDLLAFKPLSLELIDDHVLKAAFQNSAINTQGLEPFIQKKAILAAEFQKEEAHLLSKKIKETHFLLSSEQAIALSDLRKAGLGLLLSKRGYSRAIAFLEDISVHPNSLKPFMAEFLNLLKAHGKDAGVYGHAGSGCMHVRPYLDLRSSKEQALLKELMIKTTELLQKYEGSLSGEHGDGLIRSWLNEKLFGKSLYESFKAIKKAFDPLSLMNPGKIIESQDPLENIRESPLNTPQETFFSFEKEGGLELAVDLCNGNAACRKKEGVMCPSFQATNEEYHSTRARAVTLRSVLRGDIGKEGLGSKELMEVLDLCLLCKGCKTECPSNVDMAKMKAEALYHHRKKNGSSLRDRFFSFIGDLSKLGSYFPNTANKTLENKWVQTKLHELGFASQRQLPKLSLNTFSKLVRLPKQTKNKNRVVLFNDTFNEFFSPEIGLSIVSLFQKLDVEVIIPPWTCCGRTFISKGFLDEALKKAGKIAKVFYPYAEKGIPIVGIEPSCILTLKDDLVSLASNRAKELILPLMQIASVSMTLSEFLAGALEKQMPKMASLNELEVHIHGHCHEKSLIGMEPLLQTLSYFPFLKPKLIDSGCCGMAGSFGYEKEHFDLSMKIGNLILLPYIKNLGPEAYIIASGFSCRSQIEFGAQNKAFHLGQFVNALLS